MNLTTTNQTILRATRLGLRAYSLVEVLVAMAITGILFVSLYAGFSSGFAIIQLARENLRATQILVEKMETIRLYTWDQLNDTNFIHPTFEAPYYPLGGGNTNSGIIYSGRLTLANPTFSGTTPSYASNLKEVRVEVSWNSNGIQRRREMKTLVAENGLQQYIY
jgi:prepilin-type N-terminal cleavage/methylation domain-containing protein